MDGYVKIGTEIDNKSFDAQIRETEEELKKLERAYEFEKKFKPSKGHEEDMKQLQVEIEKTKNKLISLNEKQEQLNTQGFSNINEKLENIGKTTSSIVSKVGRWALAVFGIRSAYMAVRNAMSTLTQYDDQLATDLEYIRYALATTLAPIIKWLVSLVMNLLGYINMIAKAWFNVDLFAKASTKSFNKANKEATKMAKTLAGFDEMNILNSPSSGGGGGTLAPSLDLSQADGNLNNWIGNLKTKFKSVLEEIRISLNDPSLYETAFGKWGSAIYGISAMFLGLGDVFNGVVETIIGLIEILVGAFTGNTELMKKGWEDLCNGIKDLFLGAIELAVGFFITKAGIIIGTFTKVRKFIQEDFINILTKYFGTFGTFIGTALSSAFSVPLTIITEVQQGIIKVFQGILKFFEGDFKSGLRLAFDGVKKILLAPINAVIEGINQLINGINKISFDAPDWVPVIGGKKWGFNIPKIPKLAKGGVINQPGRGVYTGSAIAGERGRELYMPLQDEQMLSMVGEAIGKYVTINANITNTMNGRVISRELKKVQNGDNFAFNR